MDNSINGVPCNMTEEEKKMRLFRDQKQLLDTFLERGAITKEQYLTSLTGLEKKMGIEKQQV